MRNFILLSFQTYLFIQKIYFENLRSDCYVNAVKNIDLLKSQHNCLENLVMSKYPTLKETKYWLSSFGRVRMSGTGSTLYIEYDNYESAEKANREIGRKYKSLMVSSLKSYDVFS
jgi:4-diphosphocytidyl-2C-methyl-D-erythritol kinase